jgi:peptidoglycan/LPS O-acetylase OafA/YrhL
MYPTLRTFVLVLAGCTWQLLDGNENREPLARLVGFTSLGKLAVKCFLLSGYLNVQNWTQSPNIWRFLKKHILRIYPGFIVASLFCAFVAGTLGAEPHQYFEVFWYGGFVKSVALLRIPVVPDVFQGTPFPVINGSV